MIKILASVAGFTHKVMQCAHGESRNGNPANAGAQTVIHDGYRDPSLSEVENEWSGGSRVGVL